MVENLPIPQPPSKEESFELLDFSNPNFVPKPKEERMHENNFNKNFEQNEFFFICCVFSLNVNNKEKKKKIISKILKILWKRLIIKQPLKQNK